MNWIQQNKKLAAILGVMIAGALGLGAWLFLAWSEYSTLRGEWDSMSQKTIAMEASKVYPSQANVAALQQQIDDYRGEFQILRTALLDPAVQRPVKPMSETEFQAKLKERAKAVKQKADESGTKLPQSFALGFEEYSDNLPPNAEASAELNVHLDVMEQFVSSLIGARVNSLDDLQRSRLPSERQKGPAPQPQAAAKGSKKGAAPAPVDTTEKVLDRYTIKCVFTTDQGQLQTVMNALSNPSVMPDFLAVRLMRVENEKSEAPTKEEVRAPAQNAANAGAGAEAAPPPGKSGESGAPASNVIAPPKPLPPDARAIIGAENLKVYLEVDYIRFREAPAADDAKPGAAPAKAKS